MNASHPNPCNAFEIILETVKLNPEIAALQFASLDFAPLLEARGSLGAADFSVTNRALELRESLHLPFWDGVMLASSHTSSLPIGAIRSARFHQSLEGKVDWITTANLSIQQLLTMSQKAHRKKQLLALTSLVRMKNDTIMHIPLLDFHIGYSEYATRLISKVIPLLGVSGSLLKSGKSYHFYGNTLFSAHELTAFLGKALLFAPIVDRAWIAHQLIEGRCALRVSPRIEYGGFPLFLRRIL